MMPLSSWTISILLFFSLSLVEKIKIIRADEIDGLSTSTDLVLPQCLLAPEKPNYTTAQLIEKKGFKAEQHFVTTSDGYKLSLVRIVNTLINNNGSSSSSGPQRDAVLFVHGILVNANIWVVNGLNARQADLRNMNVDGKSLDELKDLFRDDGNKDTLAFLLANLGYDVWLLNRRGTSESQAHSQPDYQPNAKSTQNPQGSQRGQCLGGKAQVNWSNGTQHSNQCAIKKSLKRSLECLKKSDKPINSRYWNFSLDEQILIDIPQVIDYILRLTFRKQLVYVGYCQGATALLGSMSEIRDVNEKISIAFLIGPTMYDNSNKINTLAFLSATQIFRAYLGPIPANIFFPYVNNLIETDYKLDLNDTNLCLTVNDILLGSGTNQWAQIPQDLLSSIWDSAGSHEYLQLAQTIFYGKLHRIGYGDARRNKEAYGTIEPPTYNTSKIINPKLVLWGGNSDSLTPFDRIEQLASDLSVEPLQLANIGASPNANTIANSIGNVNDTLSSSPSSSVQFNKAAFVLHKDVANLVNLPALHIILTQNGIKSSTNNSSSSSNNIKNEILTEQKGLDLEQSAFTTMSTDKIAKEIEQSVLNQV